MRCVLDWGHQNGMTRPVLSVRLSWLLKGGSNEDTEQAQAGNG
ncbi:hypothetical protein ABIC02_007941, partial [Bradyrhizobium sp. RT5a]